MKPLAHTIRPRTQAGFTIVEFLIASVLLGILLLSVTTLTTATQSHYRVTKSTAEQFREARSAFDTVTRNLSQATLAPRWDYRPEDSEEEARAAGAFRRERYERLSELHFFVDQAKERLDPAFENGFLTRTHVLGFQAPLGDAEHTAYRPLRGLMAGRVYYLEFGSDEQQRPLFIRDMNRERIAPRYRYRLMEYRPPADRNTIYADARGTFDETPELDSWYLPINGEDSGGISGGDDEEASSNPFARVLAENIIAFIVSPRNAVESRSGERVFDLAPGYFYDSADPDKGVKQPPESVNVLPPLVNVTMVAISEESALRLQTQWGDNEPAQLVFDKEWFTETASYYKDLRALEQQLLSNNIQHRIFTASARLRSSQFSSLLRRRPPA